MRRDVIELIKDFKKDFGEVEYELIFIVETDFEKLEALLERMSEIFLHYHKQVEELRRKVLEKKKILSLT
jgi:KaiC/GvpD/RAD55 family RecA-like ATPase